MQKSQRPKFIRGRIAVRLFEKLKIFSETTKNLSQKSFSKGYRVYSGRTADKSYGK